jgi:hypothetical protein
MFFIEDSEKEHQLKKKGVSKKVWFTPQPPKGSFINISKSISPL